MATKRKAFNNRETVIERLRLRDGENCWLCQKKILFWPDRHPVLGSVTIDHILPVSLGGGNDNENLKLSHYYCNNIRGSSICADEIKSRISTLFVDGEPATVKQRRENLIAVVRREEKYLTPFCAYPKQERFSMWPHVDSSGNVFLSPAKPEYLH